MSPQETPDKQPEGTKLVLVAIGLALFAVLITFIWIEQIKAQVKQDSMTVYLLTGTRHRGDLVEEKDFNEVQVPKERQFIDAFAAMRAITPETKSTHIGKRWERDGALGQLVTTDLFSPSSRSGSGDAPPAANMLRRAIKVSDFNRPGDLGFNDYIQIRAPFVVDGVRHLISIIDKVQVVALGTEYAPVDSADHGNARPTSYRAVTIDISKDDVEDLDSIISKADGDIELLHVNPAERWTNRVTNEAKEAALGKAEKTKP